MLCPATCANMPTCNCCIRLIKRQRRTVVFQDHVLRRLVHRKVEADVGDDTDDAGQPAPPQRQQPLLRKDVGGRQD